MKAAQVEYSATPRTRQIRTIAERFSGSQGFSISTGAESNGAELSVFGARITCFLAVTGDFRDAFLRCLAADLACTLFSLAAFMFFGAVVRICLICVCISVLGDDSR